MNNDYSLAQALANAAAFSVIDKARLELIARSASRQLDTAGKATDSKPYPEITLRFS